jgi:hypothetical protein
MHAILGHNCRFLQGPDTDKNEVKKLRVAISEGREEVVVIKNYRKNGSAFWNRVHVCPVRDSSDKVRHLACGGPCRVPPPTLDSLPWPHFSTAS